MLHGSKQVINHIQTIIRNNNGSINTLDADNSNEDTTNAAPKTNNFFTTEVKDGPRASAMSGSGVTSYLPLRLNTATGTNRIKNNFFNGF